MVEQFKEIGYPRAKHYTSPNQKVDFAVYSNEDIGFTANIALKDSYEFAIPHPADVDLDSEALIIDWIDFMVIDQNDVDTDADQDIEMFDVVFSMLEVDFDTTNPANILDDTNQLEYKKTFDGPYTIPVHMPLVDNGTSAVTISTDIMDIKSKLYRWIPLHSLDAPLPVFVTFVNRSIDVTEGSLATVANGGAGAGEPEAPFTKFERIMLRLWYRKRKLTATEKSVRGQMKFLRLGS
jgi:hypothetical protein